MFLNQLVRFFEFLKYGLTFLYQGSIAWVGIRLNKRMCFFVKKKFFKYVVFVKQNIDLGRINLILL